MFTRTLRKTGAVGACTFLVASALALAAPDASAATTAHCLTAKRLAFSGVPLNTFTTSRSECPGYVDGGSPYTFVIDRLYTTDPGNWPLPPWSSTAYNVKAVCGAVSENATGTLTASSCTYSPA